MISRIRIRNFLSLRDVTFDLGPLTVLIGANATGKSAVFKALTVLSQLWGGKPLRSQEGEFELEPLVTLDNLVHRGDTTLPIEFEVWLDDETDSSYLLTLKRQDEGWGVAQEKLKIGNRSLEFGPEHPLTFDTEDGRIEFLAPFRGLARHFAYRFRRDTRARPAIQSIFDLEERIGKSYRYRPSANDIAAFVQRRADPAFRPYVRENGLGTGLVLNRLLNQERETFDQIESRLRGLFPFVSKIEFDDEARYGVRLRYKTSRSRLAIPGPQECDGVLLSTFLLWRLYTAPARMCICLEEPENGLYPELLGSRLELLQEFAFSKTRPLQVLIATHSCVFLKKLRQHRDMFRYVRLVEFDETSGTRIVSVDGYRDAANLFERFCPDYKWA